LNWQGLELLFTGEAISYVLVFLVSLIVSFLVTPIMIVRLKAAGITGKDMHKLGQPEVAEMGGLVIVMGFVSAIMAAIALDTFLGILSIDQVTLFASLATILIIALIGVLDDLIRIPQPVKALIPLFAAVPLAAVRAGSPFMRFPFVGRVGLGVIYPLVVLPLEVTCASNAVNMLAGFNGIEVGMGAVAVASLVIVAYSNAATTSLIILVSGLGALVATLYYNWYPAKVFVGDIGTLSIGALMASAAILGDFEGACAIMMIPYLIDVLIKARNGFPKSFGVYKNGKLYCPDSHPAGLGQLIMMVFRGIREQTLVLFFVGVELILGLVAIWLYAPQLLALLRR
jgi:UDP-N-acetylglucosamine--dolichyl-phosphate N-acetylglucosaminephosphotransferase